MHYFSLFVVLVESARKEQRAIQTRVESAQMVYIFVFYLYLAEFSLPKGKSFLLGLFESIVAELRLQVQ